MRRIRTAGVEDDRRAAALLQAYLERFGQENEVQFEISAFTTAESMLEAGKAYDLIFLDIELPGIDGITAGHKIREKDENAIIIFVTNMARLAIRGYEVGALDFVVKPLLYADFTAKMRRVMRILGKTDAKVITVSVPNGIERFTPKELLFVEVNGHRCVYHLKDKTIENGQTLASVEQALSGCGFLKCNRCYLVNPAHIVSIEDCTVTVGNEQLQISRPRKKAFMQEWNDWLAKEGGMICG